jgi:hypothetical protein
MGRSASATCCGCGSRPPDAPPLPPDFAERYGSFVPGERGGAAVSGMRVNAPLSVG